MVPFNSFFLSHVLVEGTVCYLLWWNMNLGSFQRLYFTGLAHFECLLNNTVLFFFSTSVEFPECNEKVFMHVYLWHFLFIQNLTLHWHEVGFNSFFLHRLRPETVHNFSHLVWNAFTSLGWLQSVYASMLLPELLYVKMSFGVSPSANRVLNWLGGKKSLFLCLL